MSSPWTLILVSMCGVGCTPTFALAGSVNVAEGLALGNALAAAPGPSRRQAVDVRAVLGTPYVLAGQPQKAFLKVGLEGIKPAKASTRMPVNLAIVLDQSSSMAGDKIREAKRAAIMAVEALDGRDVVSVVAYDSTVSVIVPAQQATNKAAITSAIARIEEGGSTALFAGVSRGAAELRKLMSKTRVNRVILLSDGMANIGPSSPRELAALGVSLAREGITVTTIGLGLGYNEDLMTQLALASDGNHAFVEDATELATIFAREFGDAMSVVAQDVDVRIELVPGVKPLRVLGRDAVIDGQRVTTRLGQVIAGREKYLLVEVELPARAAGKEHRLANVAVGFDDLARQTRGTSTRVVSWSTTLSAATVAKNTNSTVEVAAVEMIANEQSKLAVALRDQGKVEQAKEVLRVNQGYLQRKNKKLRSKRLDQLEDSNATNVDLMDDAKDWKRGRKQMREEQFEIQTQNVLH